MTTHHVTARLGPQEGSVTVDGTDLSLAVARGGVRVHSNPDGAPVVTLTLLAGATVDLNLPEAVVRLEPPGGVARAVAMIDEWLSDDPHPHSPTAVSLRLIRAQLVGGTP